jgi:hypothetical protein
MKIWIDEKKMTVKVVRNGVTHSGKWTDDEVVKNVKGDGDLLMAVMTAWSGQKAHSNFRIGKSRKMEEGAGEFLDQVRRETKQRILLHSKS